MYHQNGGSIVNYCEEYGIGYDCFESMLSSFDKMVNNYEQYKKNVLQFNNTIDSSMQEYMKVIENV